MILYLFASSDLQGKITTAFRRRSEGGGGTATATTQQQQQQINFFATQIKYTIQIMSPESYMQVLRPSRLTVNGPPAKSERKLQFAGQIHRTFYRLSLLTAS